MASVLIKSILAKDTSCVSSQQQFSSAVSALATGILILFDQKGLDKKNQIFSLDPF